VVPTQFFSYLFRKGKIVWGGGGGGVITEYKMYVLIFFTTSA